MSYSPYCIAGAGAGMGSYQDAIVDRFDGWRVVPVLEWLAGDGCELADSNELTRSLAARMLLERAPIVRLRLSVHDARQEPPGWSAVWHVGKPFERDRTAAQGFTQRASYRSSPVAIVDRSQRAYRQRLENLAGQETHSVLKELAGQGASDYLALPLRTPSIGLGSLVIVSDRIGGFENEDIAKFEALALALGPVFEVVELRRRGLG